MVLIKLRVDRAGRVPPTPCTSTAVSRYVNLWPRLRRVPWTCVLMSYRCDAGG